MRGGEIGGTSCSCGRVSKECETRKVSVGWSGVGGKKMKKVNARNVKTVQDQLERNKRLELKKEN